MLRKVIQLGSETFVISLPSAWMRQHKLRKGDELEVEEAGPKLMVYPKSEARQGRAVVDVSGTEPVTKRVVAALYKAGYDEVEIAFGSQKELEIAKQTIRDEFVGFETVSETKRALVAKLISRPMHEEFDNLLRRVFTLLLEMGSECFKALVSGDYELLQSVINMDKDVNRHVNFCRRTLNTIGHRVVAKVAPTYYMVEQLERVGDCYKYLCTYLLKSKVVPGSLLKDLVADANALVRRFYELYYKFSLQGLADFWSEKEMVEKSLVESLEVAGKKELQAILLTRAIVDNITVANGALLTSRL